MIKTNIILLQSFRGGTGKSTIISNIAINLVKSGKTVVIVDADIKSPGIHAHFGYSETDFNNTFTNYLLGQCDFKDTIYDISSSIKFSNEKLFLIPSSLSISDIGANLESVTNKKVIDIITNIKDNIQPDFILIDSHPGINNEMLLMSDIAHVVINVVRPDNQDFQGAKITTEINKKFGNISYIILNKVHENIDTDMLVEKIEGAFDVPVIGALPFEDEILLAGSRTIFSNEYPEKNFSKKMQLFIDNLFNVNPQGMI